MKYLEERGPLPGDLVTFTRTLWANKMIVGFKGNELFLEPGTPAMIISMSSAFVDGYSNMTLLTCKRVGEVFIHASDVIIHAYGSDE